MGQSESKDLPFDVALLDEIKKFKLTYKQQVLASRDPKDSTFGGKTPLPPLSYHIVDAVGTLGIILLLPWYLLLYVFLFVFMFPSLLLIKLYGLCVSRPKTRIYRGISFSILSFICLFLNIPVIPFILFHIAITLLMSWIIGFVFGFFLIGPLQMYRNWKAIWPFLSTGSWYWGDIVAGIMGMQDKHTFFSFYFSYIAGLVALPPLKYFLVTNPFMHRLDTRFCNQWTPVLDASQDVLYDALFLLTSVAKPVEDWREEVQNDEFSAHYQYPPPGRALSQVPMRETTGPRALGFQFVESFSLRTHTFFPPKGKFPAISDKAQYNVVTVVLYYYNPLHYLTGNVEVNVRYDNRYEHPMYCVHGENFYANMLYTKTNDLFLRFVYQFTEDLELNENIGNFLHP